jgi:anti-sigma factor RsiW
MCDFSGRLIAWMDGEVRPDEAAGVEQHIAICGECRSCAAEFERVSGDFKEYCKTLVQSNKERKTVRMSPIVWAAAAAAVLALILAYPRRHAASPIEKPRVAAIAGTNSPPAVTTEATNNVPAPFKPGHHAARRRPAAHAGGDAACCGALKMQSQDANWAAEDPSLQIAIPAEAMFPPGAVPEGVSFVADVSIGADGRVEQLRLRPRPARFERRTDQP